MTTLSKDEVVKQLVEALEKHHAEATRYSTAKNRANATCAEFKTSPLSELAEQGYMLSLIAELEQAKKDAERYQWLRKSHHDDDSAIGVTREHMNGWGRVVGKSLRNSDLDKAIDEAIAKEQL